MQNFWADKMIILNRKLIQITFQFLQYDFFIWSWIYSFSLWFPCIWIRIDPISHLAWRLIIFVEIVVEIITEIKIVGIVLKFVVILRKIFVVVIFAPL